MEEEEKKDKKATSRKWLITVWAYVVGTLMVIISGVCVFMGKDIPDGFVGLETLLFTTGIAYIGGNVWQKQIYAKGDNDE